jgi:hypothetical protein
MGRRGLAPQAVDEPIHTYRSAVPDGEDLEKCADLAPTQSDRLTSFELEITQNPETHVLHSIDPDTATGVERRVD